MKLTIISSQVTGIYKQLSALGYSQISGIGFAQTPFRKNGMWRCEVYV